MTTKNEMSYRLLLLLSYFEKHINKPIPLEDIIEFCNHNMNYKYNSPSRRTIQNYLQKIGAVKIKNNKNTYYILKDKMF